MDEKKREELEIKIKRILPRVDMDKKMKDKMNNYYLEKNISPSVPSRIINTGAIGLLKSVQLCMFVKSINMTPNKFGLDINKYFTKDEIKLADAYKESKIDKKDNVIVFKNVDKSRDNLWICTRISFNMLDELASKGLIGYNFKTQRGAKIFYKGKDMIELPFVNPRAVDEMKKSWKLGTFAPNMITFNLKYAYGENKIVYDSINRTLTITLNEGEKLDIVDGYHRTLAALNTLEDDPEFNIGFYYLRILNYTEEEAHNLILQEAKGTPISEEQMKYMDEENINMILTKRIVNFGKPSTNLMKDKLSTHRKEISHGDKYCYYSTISDAIGNYFDTTKKEDNDNSKIVEVLLNGLNDIIKQNSNEFKNLKKSRKTSVITFNNIFAFYIALLARLYDLKYHIEIKLEDQGRMRNKIKEVLDKIDFSITNPLWKELKIATNSGMMVMQDLNLIDYNRIKDYVNQLVPESEKILVSEEM